VDQKQFQNYVDELIDIKIPGSRGRNAGYLDANPKLSVRHQRRPCDDCSLPVINRTIEYWIRNVGKDNAEWVSRCNICSKTKPVHKISIDK
jgi:hypothetical protein